MRLHNPNISKDYWSFESGRQRFFPPLLPTTWAKQFYTKLRKRLNDFWGSSQSMLTQPANTVRWSLRWRNDLLYECQVCNANKKGKWNCFLVLLTAQRYKLVIHKLKTISTSPTCWVFAELSRPPLWELHQTGCVLVWSLSFVFSSLQTGTTSSSSPLCPPSHTAVHRESVRPLCWKTTTGFFWRYAHMKTFGTAW